MPGAVAHMLAARLALRAATEQGLSLIGGSSDAYPAWLQAGAMGPDYSCPYQVASHEYLDEWCTLLHQGKSSDAVRAGVTWIRGHADAQQSPGFRKAVAWLAGYLSHIVLDATIHPVVRTIVGEYDRYWIDHRRCEMYMDAYLCSRNRGYTRELAAWTDILRQIGDASDQGMDSAIKSLWSHMLEWTYPAAYAADPPDFDHWHRHYLKEVGTADPETVFFRHATPGTAYIYLESGKLPKDVSMIYIEHCPLPVNNRFGRVIMHYDEVLRFGVDNVLLYWRQLEAALAGGDAALSELPNLNLDYGTIDPCGRGDAALWL